MRENFERSLDAVLHHEGGWSDHPRDPGGATQKGVTLATYRRYKPGATKNDLRNISDAELERIYRDGYWDAVRGDDLPSGLDYAVFDFAVNSGPARAAIYLQNLVGAAPDGKIGPLTLKAVEQYVRRFGLAKLIHELCSQRLAFLERLSTWPTFGRGWRNRVEGVRKLALEMAQSTVAPKPIPIDPSPPPEQVSGPVWPIILILLGLAAAGLFLVLPIF